MLADVGDVGGLGEELAVGAGEMLVHGVGQGGGQVGGVGFEEEVAGGDGAGVVQRATGVGAGEGAAKGDANVIGGEGGEGVGGAGVGVDEESGGMGGQVHQDFEHGLPGIAAVEGGGEGEFAGEVELGAEDAFAVGVEAVVHAAVEADFADAGGAGGEDVAEVLKPAAAAVLDEPGVEAEGGDDAAGVGVGKGGDGGPVGFGGGGGMQEVHAGGAGAGKDGGEMGGEAGILEVAVGVGPNQLFTVGGVGRCYIHGDMVKGRSISVNAQRWRGAGLALALGLAGMVSGCNTFSHYPRGMEVTTLEPLRTGEKTEYQHTFKKRMEGKDGALFAMEMGRVAQLEGDYSISRGAFERAIERTREQDEKAVISATGAAAQTGAALVNDKAIPYRAASYERTFVHHYQALNYLATNDLAGAAVEVRRANREQEEAQRRREREIERGRSKQSHVPEEEEMRDSHLGGVYAGLDEMAGAVKHSFQNAATFYLSGVVWEMLGERNSAYIDYKRALEIVPEHPVLQEDVIRLGKRLGMREDVEEFERRFPAAAEVPADGTGTLAGKARLVVLYEEGLAPQKSEMSIAYPLPSANSIGVIALPMYAAGPQGPAPVAVKVKGRTVGRTAPICNVAALAARALEEQMPGILTRQVARAVTKGVAAKAARDSGGSFGELVVLLYNVASEQADLRSWLSLPAHVHVLSTWVEPGTPRVALAAPGGGEIWGEKVTLAEGKTTLVVVTRIDLAVYSHVIVQP